MNIGLYFGSFNPIHNGHLIIANEIAYEIKLDQVWFIVSPQNPDKKNHTLLNEWNRLNLVQLAIEGNPKLFAKNIEFKLPRPSYTSNTLAYLVENYKNYTFSIIMGSDGFSNLISWHNYKYLIEGFEFIIYEREGFPITNSLGAKIKILKSPLLNVSATLIRNKIKRGLPIDYWVPEVIAEEIKNQGYYKSRVENP